MGRSAALERCTFATRKPVPHHQILDSFCAIAGGHFPSRNYKQRAPQYATFHLLLGLPHKTKREEKFEMKIYAVLPLFFEMNIFGRAGRDPHPAPLHAAGPIFVLETLKKIKSGPHNSLEN